MTPHDDLEAVLGARRKPEETVETLIDYAAAMPASDLFLITNEDHVAVAVRHLGLLRTLTRLPLELGRRCLSHIKVMADMDVVERRRPLDGRWVHDPASGKRFDLRINTIPTLHGEDCTLRLLLRNAQLLKIEELGLLRTQFNQLLAMVNSPSGMILVTGPTGSGKTTTLYACLTTLNNGQRKINTIEDPIEYTLEGVRQSQVNLKLEVGFPELLRAVLRQAPDVIMIGEIRDAVTAATAVHAANSGHLVLATLHAPTAARAVQSLLSLGIPPHFLASCLQGVVAQRLLRTLCPECKKPYDFSYAASTFDEVRKWLEPDEGQLLFAAHGCAVCYQTGYVTRTGVFEVLHMTGELRRLIAANGSARELRQQALAQDMIELRHSALLKVAQGLTNAEEVVRVVPAEHLGLDE
jgi:type II secretory ATPase GspE/PulE/Tfp pilus assembly ATPase PilB-like protein